MEHITRLHFDKFVSGLREPEIVRKYRFDSFNRIKENVFPSFRYGLNISIRPDFDFSTIVPKTILKDNKIIKHEKDVKVYSIGELGNFDLKDFLENFFGNNDKLSAFNQAFFNDVIAISIPDDTFLKNPIEINYDISDNLLISLILVSVGKNSRAEIVLSKYSSIKSGRAYTADDIRVICRENSRFNFISVQDLNREFINIQRRAVLTRENSFVNLSDICTGSSYTRSEVISHLNGSGSEVKNTILYSASGNQKFDIYTASIHEAPKTVSNILTKGVLNDEAKVLSRGLVKINENSYGSNGYEKQEALLLSTRAEADAIPNLEIHNHEVRCTHGSTIGQIDKERIFYLMSRGLSEQEAKRQIVTGYFIPVMETIRNEGIKERAIASIIQGV